MGYHVVTNSKLISEVKRSRYFKVNLGITNTIDKNGDRVMNDKDKFAYFYNTTYKTTIFAQGNLGDIRFYTDHYIKEDVMAFYFNGEEFIHPFDRNILRDKGIDFLLGHYIKKTEEEFENRKKEVELKKSEIPKDGNADLVKMNPGSVKYEDLKAWLDRQNSLRYSVDKDNNPKN